SKPDANQRSRPALGRMTQWAVCRKPTDLMPESIRFLTSHRPASAIRLHISRSLREKFQWHVVCTQLQTGHDRRAVPTRLDRGRPGMGSVALFFWPVNSSPQPVRICTPCAAPLGCLTDPHLTRTFCTDSRLIAQFDLDASLMTQEERAAGSERKSALEEL